MILLPLTPEPAPEPSPQVRTPVQITVIRLLALGFTPSERKLIQGVVALSQRRSVRVEMVGAETWTTADVFLLDGADAKVVAWAAGQPRLSETAVMWVDSPHSVGGRALQFKRPIQWPCLPALLQRALGMEITESARLPLSDH